MTSEIKFVVKLIYFVEIHRIDLADVFCKMKEEGRFNPKFWVEE